jgi:hypothetical protein
MFTKNECLKKKLLLKLKHLEKQKIQIQFGVLTDK